MSTQATSLEPGAVRTTSGDGRQVRTRTPLQERPLVAKSLHQAVRS